MSTVHELSAALAREPGRVDLAIALAEAHGKEGRWTQGLALARQAAQLHPDHRDLARVRVLLLVRAQQWRLAVQEGVSLLGSMPDHAAIWALVARAFSRLGEVQTAIDAWKSSLAHDPQNRFGWFALGNLQMGRANFPAAVAALRRAHSLGEPHANILTNLGAALLHSGDLASAGRCLRQGVQLDPKSIPARTSLAQLYMTISDEEGAEREFRHAIRIAPQRLKTRLLYAQFLTSIGRPDDAEVQLEYVLQVDPSNRAAQLGQARLLERRGDHEAAVQALTPYIRADMRETNVLTAWARSCQRTGRAAQALSVLQARSQKPLSLTEAQDLHHTIGNLHRALGDFEACFAAHQTGNRHRERDVDMGGVVTEAARSAALLAEPVSTAGRLGEGMIFIVGMLRSGTSLAEQILSRHPAVRAGGELPSLSRTLRRPQESQVGSEWAERIAVASPSELERLGRAYLTDAADVSSVARDSITRAHRLTDKQPTNYAYLGAIARILPGARIVHCTRDPLDTCVSCFFQNFGPGHAWSTELAWIADLYRAYRAQMAWWTQQAGIEVVELSYERVVDNVEGEVRRLLEALDLPFHPDCLTFHESRRDARTASVDQVRRPIYRSSVRRSDRYRPWLGSLLDGLGDLDNLPPAPSLVALAHTGE